jgi:hypothetical protein
MAYRNNLQKILIHEADRLRKRAALRSFACWCARQSEIDKGKSIYIRLAEDYILGKATREDLNKVTENDRGAAAAAGTIGFRHRFPNAPAYLCSLGTLSENEWWAAQNCAKYHRIFENFSDEDWDDEKENNLTWQQIFQLLRMLNMPFPGSADHLAPVHCPN